MKLSKQLITELRKNVSGTATYIIGKLISQELKEDYIMIEKPNKEKMVIYYQKSMAKDLLKLNNKDLVLTVSQKDTEETVYEMIPKLHEKLGDRGFKKFLKGCIGAELIYHGLQNPITNKSIAKPKEDVSKFFEQLKSNTNSVGDKTWSLHVQIPFTKSTNNSNKLFYQKKEIKKKAWILTNYQII